VLSLLHGNVEDAGARNRAYVGDLALLSGEKARGPVQI